MSDEKVVPISKNVRMVENQDENKDSPVRTNPGPIYLRLLAIFEGDVPLPTGPVKAFLMHFQDLDGETYMCPVATKSNYFDSLRKSLQRMEPIIFGDGHITKYVAEIKEEPNGKVNTSDRQGVGEEAGLSDEPHDGERVH